MWRTIPGVLCKWVTASVVHQAFNDQTWRRCTADLGPERCGSSSGFSPGNWRRPRELIDVVARAWRLDVDPAWFHAIICIKRCSRGAVTVCGGLCSTSLPLSLGSSVQDVSRLETNSCREVPEIKCTDLVIISLDLLRNSRKLPLFKAW